MCRSPRIQGVAEPEADRAHGEAKGVGGDLGLVLAVWGRNDEVFGPAGAQAFARDAKDAEVHLINGGHFLLESHLDVVAGYLRGFLGRVLC